METFLRKNPLLFDVPTRIETDRIVLRSAMPGDGQKIFEGVTETINELTPWMPWARGNPPESNFEEFARQSYADWTLRKTFNMLIFEKGGNGDSNRFLGSCGIPRLNWTNLNFEVGYWVRKSKMGQGYAAEAALAMTYFLFDELKARRVEIRCNADNVKSAAVAKKLAFDLEGRLRNTRLSEDETKSPDTLVFSRIDKAGLPSLNVKW